MTSQSLSCPFCSFSDADEYFLMLHIEELHTEDSPFVANSQAPSTTDHMQLQQSIAQYDRDDRDDLSEQYIECPEPECGENVLFSNLNEHLDFHLAERVTLEEKQPGASSLSSYSDKMHSSASHYSRDSGSSFSTSLHPSLRHTSPNFSTPTKDQKKPAASKRTSGSSHRHRETSRLEAREADPGRLGRSELGPYAFEERMPSWLWKKLSDGPSIKRERLISRTGTLIEHEVIENEMPGLVPVLAQLSTVDHTVAEAWFCHPSVIHVFAMPKEGGFCGYRNIQMLVSYMKGSKAYGYEQFPGRLPTIPTLQDSIEHAWDKGIGAHGRRQTGGIKGTRKYIGTPEVIALFESIGIPCAADTANSTSERKAYEVLLDAVEAYFRSDDDDNKPEQTIQGKPVHRTHMAPVYLQQQGHSITIVGLEKRCDGSRNLLVLDPIYKPSAALVQLVKKRKITEPHPAAMEACRRGKKHLERHSSFEFVSLTSNAPRIPAWAIVEKFPDIQHVYVFFGLDTDSYDVYPADAFKALFPWFMFSGLFEVGQGRLARVPGDASFDRLGVPALSVGCEWDFWMKERDIAPLVLAANSKALIQPNQPVEDHHNGMHNGQSPSSPIQPFPALFGDTASRTCSCLECVGSGIELALWQAEQANTYQSALSVRGSSPSTSPPSVQTAASPQWCSCWQCRNISSPVFPSHHVNAQDRFRSPRRYPYRKRYFEVAFPTARAYLNGGTPLSKASKAYIKPSPTETSSPLPMYSPNYVGWQYAYSPAETCNSWSSTPPSSPPLATSDPWSPASSYGPMTPYSQAVSGDSMMGLLPSTPLSAMSSSVVGYDSPLTRYNGYQQLHSSEHSSESLGWTSIQADLVIEQSNGGAHRVVA